MVQRNSPVVFVSHSHEDKDRFVTQFATRLLENGIDAWVDKWEILPGDSFAGKIFDGLGKATAVVAIISANSVNSKWVKDELDAATVKRITDQCRLIPVIIDEVEVPPTVRHLERVKIDNLDSYEDDLRKIVNAVFEHIDKPPLGAPPAYVTTALDAIPGLTEIDTRVFRVACQVVMDEGHFAVNPQPIFDQLRQEGLSTVQIMESVEVLENRSYVETRKGLGAGIALLVVTSYGFDEYAKTYVPGFDEIIQQVIATLVNTAPQRSEEIVLANTPRILINHVIETLVSGGLVKAIRVKNGYVFSKISSELKRYL
ncbi:MAG: toll/interleukin-1 receptor domain-containing protein [bacterium]|nr:toll/interleukin-1 receptor domain-containing protein [bacterium]